MSEQITEERAIKIAKWLSLTHRGNFWSGHISNKELPRWLYSPEGQSALMKKILETPRVKLIIGGSTDKVHVEISYWDKVDGLYEYAETLEHALLLAVLKMIVGE